VSACPLSAVAARTPLRADWPRRPSPRGAWLAAILFSLLLIGSASAQITRVGGSNAFSARTVDQTISINAPPAGIVENDLLLVVLSISGPALTSLTAPSGWQVANQSINAGHSQLVLRKLAGAAEAGPYAFSWTLSGGAAGNDRSLIHMLAYRGVDLADPIAAGGAQFNPTSGNQVIAPSITPGVADTRLIGFFGLDRSGGGAPAVPGMGNLVTFETGAGPGGITLSSGDQAWPSPGATGDRVASFGTSAQRNGQLLALRPMVTTVLDHIRILHGGTALTCQPAEITLRACADPDCIDDYPDDVAVSLTSPATGWIGGTTVTIPGGGPGLSMQLRRTSPGIATLGASASAPTANNPTRCFNGALETCVLQFDEAGFLFEVPNHVAGELQTPITIRAVQSDPLDPLAGCGPAFSGDQPVGFWYDYVAPDSGTLAPQVNGVSLGVSSPGTPLTLSFDADAQASFSLRYLDAGQLRLHARHDGSGDSAGLVLLGSDLFAAQPAGLCVRASGADADCVAPYASCSVFTAAGSPFVLELRAVHWVDGSADLCGNPVTPNYRQGGIELIHTLLAPAAGAAGTLALATASFVAADNGVATIATQAISEVGVFTVTATPPTGDYFGMTVPAATSAAIGRFVPHHFDVVAFDGCNGSSFSYSGQPFQVSVFARNLLGATTLNYDGSGGFARPTRLSDAGDETDFSNNVLAAADFVQGTASTPDPLDPDPLSFTFATPPQPAQTLTLRAIDSDGVSSESGSSEASAEIRSGRLWLGNAVGSGNAAVNMPLRIESWQELSPPGGVYAWQVEADDSCTALTTDDFTVSDPASSISAVDIEDGVGTVTVQPIPYGNVDVTAVLDGAAPLAPWLQFDWDGDGNLQNPTGRVGFGLNPGQQQQIFRREVIGQ
jgi:MSHA biogenesis protein MshQ